MDAVAVSTGDTVMMDNRMYIQEVEAIQADERHRAFVWRSLILLSSIALMGTLFIAAWVRVL